jgi:hypothetical protein
LGIMARRYVDLTRARRCDNINIMNVAVAHARRLKVIFALVLLVLGGFGQSMAVHAGMTPVAAAMTAMHAMSSMPMDHASMDGKSDTDMEICKLQCLALAVALPICPTVAVVTQHVEMARPSAVLLPVSHVSGPDRPPPKRFDL